MKNNQKKFFVEKLAVAPSLTIFALLALLASGMLATTTFYLFEKTAYFDDSFIYLHITANIVESGTARYFPIADSGLLLSSSPLRLLTLVPGFFLLDVFGVSLRTIEAARFAFLTSGFVAFLCFLPFWLNKIKYYFVVATGLFFLAPALDSLLLMEGGVLFFSLFTLVKLLTERSDNFFVIGIVIVLVGLSRPEIGVIATVSTLLIYINNRRAVIKIFSGFAFAFVIYWLLMSVLGVYPIPSTIWSKQITGKLKLFSDENLIEVLPFSIARLMGYSQTWIGWAFVLLPAAFAVPLRKAAIPIVAAIVFLLLIAIPMPGNFVWYSENFIIVIFALATGVTIELYKSLRKKAALLVSLSFFVAFTSLLSANFGKNRPYPWNEGSPGFIAYHKVGKSSVGDGKYILSRYSNEPVRIRMCEIGIVSYFSGGNSWIYDICGLAQIGNLKGASQSWCRHFYPPSFLETGDDQLQRFNDADKTKVVDVWALRSKEEVAGAVGNCQFVDDMFCINQYK